MGNLNCCSGGCYPRKTNTPKRSTSTTSWVRRFRSRPQNRVHPTTDTVEELPEDKLEELSNSNLQEEALPTSVAGRAAYEHGPQKVLVVEVHQASAEEEPLKNLKTYGTAYEHAPQEGLVVKRRREAWVEGQPLRAPKESGAVFEYAPQEGLVVKRRREAWGEEQPLRAPKESGAVFEYDFIEDLPINPACDRTEETPCVSKVALQRCESECFLQSISSSDEEENADSPHDCCPQTPENFMEDIEDLEKDNKNTEMSESSLVIFVKSAFGNIINDDEEDLEEQV
ncbi:uncharacterized protein [Bos taurus]|uniref:uncharacterized protein n=1 Tax=Bos taurus TaxID=9913 RepID=UPI000383AF47|nr:uncharacterized protein LOC101907330 [Bos taurus]